MHRISTGRLKGRKLAEIGDAPIRPPLDKIKQAIFNMFYPIEGRRGLDLFAGSGSLGLEALSRGASFVTFVENHKDSLKVLRENINTLGVGADCEVLAKCVHTAPTALAGPYDLLLVDPPYALYDRPKELQALANTLDKLAESGILAPGFRGALESPRGKWQSMTFHRITVAEVRKYGQTELLILA